MPGLRLGEGRESDHGAASDARRRRRTAVAETLADTAQQNLQDAIARNDEEARYHEFGRLTIIHQQAGALASEAENCVGEDLTFLGPTEVLVTEPELPDNPTLVTGPDFPIVEPLPVASPQA